MNSTFTDGGRKHLLQRNFFCGRRFSVKPAEAGGGETFVYLNTKGIVRIAWGAEDPAVRNPKHETVWPGSNICEGLSIGRERLP